MNLDHSTVAEANRRFYARIADLYDRTESCVADHAAQVALEADLDQVLSHLSQPAGSVRALDACGGSGNVALKLLNRGLDVTVADISRELLDILERKAAAVGRPAKTHCGEIAAFLESTDATFDLVVFSSALHHLQDIDRVLTLVFRRLRPGGLLFTLHDPTARRHQGRLTPFLLRAEYFAFKFFKQPGDVPAAALRKLRRAFGGRSGQSRLSDDNLGVVAEYHIRDGIDDLALVERLKQVGYQVVRHDRLHGARFALVQAVVSRIGQPTGFKLLLRKPNA
ncbi:MAG: class I SAM-dependent methyltransferase [Verrucomicrobiales bacterium]|nr:class I SAM-dependent methyltransferase [Verrucomicrobiales bacterium]